MQDGFFRVDGADLETGEETYVVLQAASMEEAEAVARKQGLLIAAVRAAVPSDWGVAAGAVIATATPRPPFKKMIVESPRPIVATAPSGRESAPIFSGSPIEIGFGAKPQHEKPAVLATARSGRAPARAAAAKSANIGQGSILEFATSRSPAPSQRRVQSDSPTRIQPAVVMSPPSIHVPAAPAQIMTVMAANDAAISTFIPQPTVPAGPSPSPSNMAMHGSPASESTPVSPLPIETELVMTSAENVTEVPTEDSAPIALDIDAMASAPLDLEATAHAPLLDDSEISGTTASANDDVFSATSNEAEASAMTPSLDIDVLAPADTAEPPQLVGLAGSSHAMEHPASFESDATPVTLSEATASSSDTVVTMMSSIDAINETALGIADDLPSIAVDASDSATPQPPVEPVAVFADVPMSSDAAEWATTTAMAGDAVASDEKVEPINPGPQKDPESAADPAPTDSAQPAQVEFPQIEPAPVVSAPVDPSRVDPAQNDPTPVDPAPVIDSAPVQVREIPPEPQVIAVTAKPVLVPKSGTPIGPKRPMPASAANNDPPPRIPGVVRPVPERPKPWVKPKVPARPIGFVPPSTRAGGTASKSTSTRRPGSVPPGSKPQVRLGSIIPPRRIPPPAPPAETTQDREIPPFEHPRAEMFAEAEATPRDVSIPSLHPPIEPPPTTPEPPIAAAPSEHAFDEDEQASAVVAEPASFSTAPSDPIEPAPVEVAPLAEPATSSEESIAPSSPAADYSDDYAVAAATPFQTTLTAESTSAIPIAYASPRTPAGRPSTLVLFILCPLATLVTLAGAAVTLLGLTRTAGGDLSDVEKIDFHIQTLTQTFLGGIVFVAGLMIFFAAGLAHVAGSVRSRNAQ